MLLIYIYLHFTQKCFFLISAEEFLHFWSVTPVPTRCNIEAQYLEKILQTKSGFLKSIITISHLCLNTAYILIKSVIFYLFFSDLIIRFFLCLFHEVLILCAIGHALIVDPFLPKRNLALEIASCVCVCVCVCVQCVRGRSTTTTLSSFESTDRILRNLVST
jgi:hypothetical protein